ncbi:MAG TPA: hypothetical protein VHW23_04955 [Kofleriaceae bacterium]|nr:hypothetical protein [Kofleriaceae bacterium]
MVPAAGGGGTGPDAGGGGGGGMQAQMFATVITPLVSPKCTGCHAGVQVPNLSSYDALQAIYKTPPGASNILVTEADATQGMHNNILYFTADQKTQVINWINTPNN